MNHHDISLMTSSFATCPIFVVEAFLLILVFDLCPHPCTSCITRSFNRSFSLIVSKELIYDFIVRDSQISS